MLKKGPSPAIGTTLGSGALTLSFGTSTAISTIATAALGGLTGSIISAALSFFGALGALSAPLTASFGPYFTPGMDFGAGITRGLQDALTGGDLLTEILSAFGLAPTVNTTVNVVAPSAPCPFC